MVSDMGQGIPPEHIPRLFDRFYRVDSPRSLLTAETGLGLTIVKSIMDLHKGQVIITSQLGQGTTITLIFPANDYFALIFMHFCYPYASLQSRH